MRIRKTQERFALVIGTLVGVAGIAWAIPGFHIRDDASAQKAVQTYAEHPYRFRPVVYQALLDKNLWRLALAAHDYLAQKPGDPERECSFALAYWQSQQVGTSENVPQAEGDKLRGLYDEAVQDTQDAAKKLPDSVAAHLAYGQYLQYFVPGVQKVPQMLYEYRAAVALMPKSGELHYKLGDALFSSGDFSHARIAEMIAQYKQALRLDPKLTESYSFIAASYWQEQDWSAVKVYLDKYIAADPAVATRPDVVAALKTAKQKLGD